MSDDVSSEQPVSGGDGAGAGVGHTASDSIPFSDNSSGASSGNYSFPPGEDPQLVNPDDKYLCIACHNLLKDPIQTSCGHRMCKDCVEKFLGPAESRPCPAQDEDCGDVRRNNVYPDPGCKREIKQLLVYCPNKISGCPVKIKLGQLDKHKLECEYRSIPCPYACRGCDVLLPVKEVEAHKLECGFRPVWCDLCGIEFNANEKQNHDENECPEAKVKCPYKCSKKLKRRQLEDHMQSCPKKPTECPYKSLGCKFEGSKEDVRIHAQDIETHFQVLISFTVQAEIEKRQANEELDTQRKKQEALSVELNTIHRELRLKMMQQVERIMHLEQKFEEMQASLRQVPQQMEQLHLSVEQLKGLIPQVANHDRQVAGHEIRMAEMDLRFQMLETASYDGQLLWKIRDVSQRKRVSFRDHLI